MSTTLETAEPETQADDEAIGITVADLLERFGPIPVTRIRQDPAPGTATEADVVEIELREDLLYELIDGILLRKVMAYLESALTMQIIILLGLFVRERRLGVVTGPEGMMRLAPGLVRLPDIAFVSWVRLNYQPPPSDAIAPFGPELAIEVLSKGNTKKEMADKLVDYFAAGARLVWYVDPKKGTVTVHDAPDRSVVLKGDDLLTGGDVLPGFSTSVVSFLTVPGPPEAPGTAK